MPQPPIEIYCQMCLINQTRKDCGIPSWRMFCICHATGFSIVYTLRTLYSVKQCVKHLDNTFVLMILFLTSNHRIQSRLSDLQEGQCRTWDNCAYGSCGLLILITFLIFNQFIIHLPKMPHHYQYNVTMSCSGCSKAVEKALSRLEGVNKTDVDLKAQTVDVVTDDSLNYETVLNTISKTGKKVNDGKTIN